MAFAHNAMIRGLNAIYLQAPHVTKKDASDFLFFVATWSAWILHHHDLEETSMFPKLEAVPGIKQGQLSRNTNQHELFVGGLKSLNQYATKTTAAAYDGKRVHELIDAFAHHMTKHLADEIGTLWALDCCEKGKEKNLLKIYNDAEAEAGKQSKTAVPPMVLGLCDKTFEGGNDWPVMPPGAAYIVHYIFSWWHRGAWRFLPSDTFRTPRHLAFSGPEKEERANYAYYGRCRSGKGTFVSLEIAQFERKRAPPYVAVSYTWGEENDMVTLRLNERNFSVTRNLWLCLTYLGFHAQRSKARYLWVDAICINQGNVPERNAQVRVMDEIYKNAHHVSIWLGPGLEFYKSWIEGLVGTVDMDGSDWSEVKQLANHEYWSRRWVIQECLLAREIQIHCGSTIMTWGDFQEALSLEANVNLLAPAEDSVITKMLDTKQHGALPLLLARNPVGGFSQRPLEELIIHHRHSRCKDPRDRVFALLGLLENWERRCLERYFPNYSLSHDGVVVITVAHLRELNGASVTLKSQNLFQGLGVESKDRQRRLIAAAEDCPYYIGYDDEIIISDESRQERAGYMGWDGGLEIDQYEEIVDGVQTGDGMGSGVSRCNIL